MGRGGYRANAGRRPGAKGTKPNRPSLQRSHQEIRDARERARSFIERHESGIVEPILQGDDDRLKWEVLKTAYAYAWGQPTREVKVEHGPSATAILLEIARQRHAGALPAKPDTIEAEVIEDEGQESA
jgi:hypothetical protein